MVEHQRQEDDIFFPWMKINCGEEAVSKLDYIESEHKGIRIHFDSYLL